MTSNFDNDVLTINDFKNKESLEKWLRRTASAFSIVLNDNGCVNFQNAKHILRMFTTNVDYNPLFIAICLHDKDYDPINERLETPHYQIVAVFNESMQFKSLLKLIEKLFPGTNDNQIGIQKCTNVGAMARYVLHRGFYDKHPYSLTELETNNIDLYMKYYNMIDIKDAVDCCTVVEQYHYDLKEIICHVSNYNKWSRIIKDLISDNRYRGRL